MPEADSHALESLRQQFHVATEQFHQRRADWEKWLDASEFRHQERVDAAWKELRKAESALEEVEGQIQRALLNMVGEMQPPRRRDAETVAERHS